ncbi:MAG TPA: hypothetical protein VFF14_05195 [Candidatus Deferrimicrobium sp.]|nr:hypothetical protein [Candidatus Deferrimicrobium sp.]
MNLKKQTKVIFSILGGVIAVFILMYYISLNLISVEFKQHLIKQYPNESFRVGFVKIDPIYGTYFAEVTSVSSETTFGIRKIWKTNEIQENYLQRKSAAKSNSEIEKELEGVSNSLIGVSGNKVAEGQYGLISLDLKDGVEPLSTTRKALNALKSNNITAEMLIVRYGDAKHVYEIHLTPGDYSLTEDELKSKVINIK